jgi:hypothetical protein
MRGKSGKRSDSPLAGIVGVDLRAAVVAKLATNQARTYHRRAGRVSTLVGTDRGGADAGFAMAQVLHLPRRRSA